MKKILDNTAMWNEAAKGGALFGAVSVGCLTLKELASFSGSTFLAQAAAIILWAVEFFGCILLMKKLMLDLRDKYEDVRMEHTRTFGRRAALLSGLLLASAQALFIMQMPADTLGEMVSTIADSMQFGASERQQVEGMMGNLPIYTFLFQWAYCFLYGSLLASFMSRYIFLQRLFRMGEDDINQKPDEQ